MASSVPSPAASGSAVSGHVVSGHAVSGSAAPSLHAPRPPRRVLIANRGEIVVRIARTCAAMGIDTVAVYSDADADGLHVRACDQAVRLTGTAAADTYLRADLMIGAARKTGADAIHPGFGFLAEDAAFAQLVLDEGLTWVGPQPDVIARMGDKLTAKTAMEAAGVPVLPGAALADPGAALAGARNDDSSDPGAGDDDAPAPTSREQLLRLADTVGFPLMVKAAAGGGGKGMRVVHDRVDLPDAVDAARREATAAFGDGRLFLERYVARPRHLEVQVLGDTHGSVVHLFERECSIQRRHQKIVEESPSLAIDGEVRAALCAAAVDAASAIGYVNAGTVEFVADEALLARRRAGEDIDPRETFAFLEVNTRLQVEHPVTEEVVRVVRAGSGAAGSRAVGAGDGRIDLVREQLLVAGGSPLRFTQDDLVQVGHAIEVRLYAEDPAAGDLPATGELAVFAPDRSVRWELGIAAGETVSPYYDPMLAKAIASAPTRPEAAGLLARALARSPIVGVTTNQDLLLAILRDASFLDGDTTTAYLDERRDLLLVDPDDDTLTTAAMLVALHAAVQRRTATATAAGTAVPASTVPVPGVRIGFAPAGTYEPQVDLRADGRTFGVRYHQQRDGRFAVRVAEDPDPDAWDTGDLDAAARVVSVLEHTADSITVQVGIHRFSAMVAGTGDERAVAVRGRWVRLTVAPRFPETADALAPGASVSPMPGRVVEVAVAVGDEVAAGALLVIVEAMKMEHRLTAPVAGTVAEVRVTTGQQIDADEVLVVATPEADAPDAD